MSRFYKATSSFLVNRLETREKNNTDPTRCRDRMPQEQREQLPIITLAGSPRAIKLTPWSGVLLEKLTNSARQEISRLLVADK